ncbi:hypothetical protein BU52_01890 [Streptomyces toyocaensis]|uniref:Uncharacterized protein n=1 Tax=Streptomyces toyocaensis TaxID=55952 RepID=A0A081XZ53_STRTO|nr:hypothetical protein [Streptomyces toyocaensis]KES08826.1 hypothetical protein BU52_01890 [Streptomyces toyocaensis]
MNEAAAYTLHQLRALEPAVRTDVLRVLDRVVRDLPAHWSRRRGIPQLMVFLDGHGDARTERTGLRELARYGFLDELHRWVGTVPAHKAEEHGCAALVYGDRVHARINGIGPLGWAWFRPDTCAQVHVAHRRLRRGFTQSRPSTAPGGADRAENALPPVPPGRARHRAAEDLTARGPVLRVSRAVM